MTEVNRTVPGKPVANIIVFAAGTVSLACNSDRAHEDGVQSSHDRPSLAHRIGNAETPRDRNELANPHGARRGFALTEQRVDRDEELRPIVHRETPIGVREAGGNGVERKRQAVHVELRPPDRARTADVELETEHIA